jgi:alkylation response protein AidB-like acyl-CoA dehydrogenase
MCYVMHIGAVEALKLRATDHTIEKYLKKVREGLIGTLSYSDPETGSHFWYPIASGARRADGGYEVLKKASWTTSAGFADFYVLQTTSPDYNGDYSNLSVFVVDAADIQAKPEEWDAMGLRGNQSGSLLLDWKFVPEDQLVGPIGDGVCDYPTIQDAVGEAIMDTNASRMFVYSVAQALDKVTDGSQTNPAVGELARGNYLHWLWQIKFNAAKNVAHVVDKMLHCCGGTGYKKEPLQLERYLRDGKAGWVMGPTNEVLRQFVGKTALLGMDSLDYWNVSINERVLNNELKKFSPDQKRELAERLMSEAGGNGAGS